MTKKTENEEDSQTIVLKEILKWIKFGTMPQLKSLLMSILDTDQKRNVYQLSDGKRNIGEIMKLTGIGSNHTIATYWKIWKKQNLGSGIPVAGGGERFKREFNLEEIGLINEMDQTPGMSLPKEEEDKSKKTKKN
jgi:hypothetical protein